MIYGATVNWYSLVCVVWRIGREGRRVRPNYSRQPTVAMAALTSKPLTVKEMIGSPQKGPKFGTRVLENTHLKN